MSRGLVAAAAVALVAVVAVAPSASADSGDDVPVGTRLAARTHPAVQLTSLTYSGEVVVPTGTIKQGPFNQLVNQATVAVLDGKISSDERSIAKYLFQQMAADVNRYLKPTSPERTVKAQVGGLCTGWWVTPDGYMVTGAHCVEMSDQELSDVFAAQALEKFNKQDAKSILKDLRGISADAEMVQLAQQIYVTFNSSHLKIRGLRKSLSVLQSLPGGGVDKTAKAVPAELVSVGESYPGKDFALLKVNGQQNLPTLPLGDDGDVQTGNTLYISGFPGLVTNTPFFSLESKLEPALTEGPYNAKRTTQEGVPYIQTQAPSYHGNSGGPVFSKDGKVIGMLIAGTVSDTGESSENESFVLPVSIIKEKLNEKNIKPAESLTTRRYNEALDDFFKRHYKDALPKFREVQALHPIHPYVAKYISDSQQAISSGKDETPQPMWLWIVIGAGVLLAILGGLALLSVILRRRKRAATPAPYGGGYAGSVAAPPWQQSLPPGPQSRQMAQHQSRQQVEYDVQAHVQGGVRGGIRDDVRGNAPHDAQAPVQAPFEAPAGTYGQRPDGPTQYVRPMPSPYGRPAEPVADQPSAAQVAELERELAELRRRLEQRPPGA
ncbi:trypsin-like peptidase domain-containing protein [Planotetraspora sp. GP83]|uniref:S1 family peptidase n=1 Tax=Planotetraspora sp. GP83 TaxID=3156264 RepID=UPI00351605FD